MLRESFVRKFGERAVGAGCAAHELAAAGAAAQAADTRGLLLAIAHAGSLTMRRGPVLAAVGSVALVGSK